ncbi:MAG: DUF975 family protein [Eubacterium sp.]|nr:DUF975 family protein [Eubacterium sp.]
MNLNRGLIKQQAKQLINGNVFKLFFICLIVYLCMSALTLGGMGKLMSFTFKMAADNGVFNSSNYKDYDFDRNYDFYDYDYFYNFQNNSPYDFEYNYDYDLDKGFNQNDEQIIAFASNLAVFWILYMLGFVAMIFFMPLTVSTQGLFVSLIRGKQFSFSEGLKNVFGNTFKNNYGKKLGLVLLRGIIIYLWSLLFVIPGIVYAYSSYFANQIMCDSPEISPSKALETSKKMVKGNRTELFVMNLSFIPWYILCAITCGLGYIYVVPYLETTNALYYENFRIRALQEGRVTEDDFLSDNQIRAKYANFYANPNGAPNGNPYQQNGYQPYNQPNNPQYYNQQNANPYYNTQSNGPYYSPQQNGCQPNQQPYYAPNPNAYNAPPPQAQQAEYTNEPKAEAEIKPENTDTADQPKTFETRDPWEINHED